MSGKYGVGIRDIYAALRNNLVPHRWDEDLLPFLQMVQAETAQLGCSIQLCKPRDKASFYSVVCRYSIPHVKTRVPLYLTGKPCSQCRKGFKCDQITKLCVS
ncbi:hypothetical protein DICVIV_14300 [Dictyocaulus viviparus]|uniref:SCP domain-containing protein n=1 Tax=Dictyocaulus viviparus TaxID=29172 RepID=A0A0D8X833_DICVI|nr:hypothetical protein DICVIV_14300 [Dictyocaulus viviparus]